MKNFSLSLTTKTLTITKAFEDAVAKGEGDAYETYKRLMEDIPDLKVIRKTHASPRKYVNKQGEQFNCNQFKNLKYENMERFMMGLPNGDVYMDEYLFLRNHASDVQTNGYALIRRWFVAQFPDFRKNPMAYITNQPEVIHANEFAGMAENEVEKVA